MYQLKKYCICMYVNIVCSMKLPRKLKKKLINKHGSEIVKKIIRGELIYKSNQIVVMTKNGWKVIDGKKQIYMTIQ